MLDTTRSQKIINKLKAHTKKPLAILDQNYTVLSNTKDLEDKIGTFKKAYWKTQAEKGSLLPLHFQGLKMGYIYFDGAKKTEKELLNALTSMVELYFEQLIFIERIPHEESYLDKFIYELLNEKESQEILTEKALLFGIDLHVPRLAIAIIVEGENKEKLLDTKITTEEKEHLIRKIQKDIQAAVGSFFTSHKKNIIGYAGDNVFVLLKDLGTEDKIVYNIEHIKKSIDIIHGIIKDELRSPITIGVGDYYASENGLSQSFGEAFFAARLGEDLWGEGRVYHFNNFGIIAPLMLGESEKLTDMSKDLFENFPDKKETLKTLDIFFDNNMSLTETAKKLKIHRNTLVYRLDRITDILNLDPRFFDDAVQIRLAMIFNNFVGEAK